MTRRKAPRPLDLDPRRWMPLAEAIQRVRAGFDSMELAENDLHDKLVHAPPRLQAAYQVIVYDAEHPHGFKISGLIERVQWEHYKPWGSRDGTVRLRCIGKRDEILDRRGVRIFVRRAEFDRLYPPPETTDVLQSSRRTPGPKPTDDWPDELAAALISIAATDPKALRNIDKLVERVQTDFADAHRFLPQDPKPVRAKIQRLLKYVR